MANALTELRFLLIDLDGVLYRGDTALPDAERFICWLRQRGLHFRLVTNNSTLTPAQYVRKLAAMGIEVQADEIFTSALATALYLRERGAAGQSVFVVGEDGLRQALEGNGMIVTADHPQWVVAGLDRQLTYETLSLASLALEAGASFVGTNPDTSFPTERGLVPGAGAILALLTATTGRQPVVIGKPEPLMLELAMRSLGGNVTDTAMLGDRLDTDIKAGNNLGMMTILVLTGVSTQAEIASSGIRPDLVVNNLADLLQRWGG